MADSSATTSPARTRSPLWNLIAASWPPTSGATRTSVVRTTPTIGGVAVGRDSQYPPAPTASATMPNALIRPSLPLTMHLPPLDQKCRHHRECEIDDREAPQSAPIADELPQGGAQLIDANEAVDREIRREDAADGLHPFGNHLARPRKPGQEELRQAGADEDQRRGLRVFEPGARRLAHEAGRQGEQQGERE